MFRTPAGLAFDLLSVQPPARSYDRDGRLRVSIARVSKATVNPYYGAEIPLDGLDPARIYKLWRTPSALAAAVASFNGLPILARHVPVSADDHRPSDVVGAAGTEADFDDPFLTNSLIIWAASAIRGIEDGSCQQLSCSYYYRPIMNAGTTPDGQTYDGVMTKIEGNHVSMVSQGRAGPECAIDAALPRLRDHINTRIRRCA